MTEAKPRDSADRAAKLAIDLARGIRSGAALGELVLRASRGLAPLVSHRALIISSWSSNTPQRLTVGPNDDSARIDSPTAAEISALSGKLGAPGDNPPLIATGPERSAIALRYGGETCGALEIEGSLSGPLGTDEGSWISLIAEQLAVALGLERERGQAALHLAALAKVNEQLSFANRLEILGELAASTAHELNNVLSAIIGRAQILHRAIEAPEVRRSLAVIERAALDGSTVAHRLRAMVRDEPLGEEETIQVAELIEDTIGRAETRVEKHGWAAPISIEAELGPAPPIRGDAAGLRQVLTNLLYNAVDAMPGGGQLTVRCGQGTPPDEVFVEVADTGAGMEAATLAQVFEPFFTTKGAHGTGLGLSVSRGIVDRHGGRIEIDSTPGRGTRVRVWLPIASDPPGAPSRRDPTTAGVEVGPPATRARILVIDDDHAVRETLTEILRSSDYQVTAAANGPDGLALFRQEAFDLVFTDLGMPGMNGWEVAADIKAQSPGTAVGVITGWDTRVDRSRLADLGVDLIVSKPFRFQQVLEVVSRVLAGRPDGAG
ncbi:MAG: response regulator [Deltaproteobacteria bacterium]|nr:response regulator [Deltaproteobacteria bacterium]